MSSEFVNFSLNVIGPVVLMLTAGKLLRATKQINEGFISGGSKLVFNFALPALLFISIGHKITLNSLDPSRKSLKTVILCY